MPHSFNEIWIHAIWAIKERRPLINKNMQLELFKFISSELKELRCPVKIVTSMSNHIHCLFMLRS